ncbi:hypothetical protein [Actinomadura sp. DC4]|uniref:hypothetical protein n=1 Tax=Actinomadura sp. DC4 TaxID=3055069 RepID=UPI0025B26C49|nr:hypothetical protein [Actinomadura sp. DC4]MDN3354429.1 hypothetical protein [Actinomadura sp. DC4]
MFKFRSSVCVATMTAGLALAGSAAAGAAQAITADTTVQTRAHQRADTIIRPTATLHRNQAWTSGNGRTILRLQQDGNLVLYKDGRAAWQAPNAWSRGVTAVFQQDGNFVVYNGGGGPVWASGTWHKGDYLAVQDDGNLVIYNGNHRPVWATNTGD